MTETIYSYYNTTSKKLFIGSSKENVATEAGVGVSDTNIKEYNTVTSTSAVTVDSKCSGWRSSTSATTVQFVDRVSPASTRQWFKDFTALETIENIENLDTSHVMDMSFMFYNCSALKALDVSGFDTGNVMEMRSMFSSCSSLAPLDVSGWDTRRVESMRFMFYKCTAVTPPDVSNWVTSSLTEVDTTNSARLTEYIFATTLTERIYYYYSSTTGLLIGSSKSAVIQAASAAKVTITEDKVKEYNTVLVTSTGVNSLWGTTAANNITFVDRISPATTQYWFYKFTKMTNVNNIGNLDTSHVMDMSHMFDMPGNNTNSYLTNLNVSNFDTSNVTDMSYMFRNCRGLRSVDKDGNKLFDFSNWNTSRVTNMESMFNGCYRLKSFDDDNNPLFDVSNWNTSRVTNMTSMFNSCYDLTALDVSNWDTGSVTTMASMFSGCSDLTTLDVSKWNTSSVTTMASMFNGCSSLTALDVSKWNTNSVTTMASMFSGCRSLTALDFSDWNTGKVTTMESMFNNCSGLKSFDDDNNPTFDVSGFDTQSVTTMKTMFNGCSSLTALDFSNWNTGKVTTMESMFNNCSGLKSFDDDNKPTFDVSGFDTQSVTTMKTMFNGCSSLTELVVLNWDTSKVTDMESMFNGCSNLTKFDTSKSNWNTGKVTTMKSMFNGCSSLKSLDVSNWNTGSVMTMESMFNGCSSLTTLDVSKWDTGKVTTMESMFNGCSSLTTLDVSNWTTSKVTTMKSMFNDCSSLKTLVEPKFDTTNVTTMASMFAGCSVLDDLDLSSFAIRNRSIPTDVTDMFKGADKLDKLYAPSIDTGIKVTLPDGKIYWDKTLHIDVSGFIGSDNNKHELLLHMGPVKGHTIGFHKAEEPTCTQKGTQAYYQCIVCEMKFDDENGETELKEIQVVPAKGHTNGEWKTETEASCVLPGTRSKRCLICNDLLDIELIPATGHSVGDEYEVLKPASCTESGVGTGKCTKCDTLLEFIEIPATGHKMKDGYVEDKAPTCTEFGIGHGECEKCDYKGIFEIPATGHTWSDEYAEDKAATCTEAGSESQHCEKCGAINADSVRPIPLIEHSYGEEILTHDATCTKEGYTYRICAVCGDTKKVEDIPVTGHKYGEWQDNGAEYHILVCERCGDIQREKHDWGDDWHEHNSESRERECSVCHRIELSVHDWDEGVVTKAATHLEEGEIKYTCKICKTTTKTEVIPKTTEHTFGDWEEYDEAQHKRTCACGAAVEYGDHAWSDWAIDPDNNQHKRVCKCGTKEYEDHAWSDWTIDPDNNDQHKGVCKCGAVKYEDHDWKTLVDIPATHFSAGKKIESCTVCGVRQEENFDQIKHTFGEWERYNGTLHMRKCTATECDATEFEEHEWGAWTKVDDNNNQHKHVCKCGAEEFEDHKWDNGTVKAEATHLKEGEMEYTCTICHDATKTEAIPKTTEHSFGDWELYGESDGDKEYVRRCECGAAEIDKHAWNAGEVIEEATHLTEGKIKYTCQSGCGTTKIEVIPKTTEHSFGDWEEHDGTQHKRTCGCGEVEYENHAWDAGKITIKATHTTPGERTYTCTICKRTTREVIPEIKTEHSFGDWQDNAKGQHIRVCAVCGGIEGENHAWGDWQDNGTEQHIRVCTTCGEIEREEHVWGEDWHEYNSESRERKCSACGRVEISVHDWEESERIEATHTSEGKIIYTCKNECGTTKEEVIPKIAQHSFGAWQYSVDGQQHIRTCACGEIESGDHVWSGWQHSGDGQQHTHVCAVCGEIEGENHVWSDWQDNGAEQHIRVCDKCGGIEREDHQWGAWHIHNGESRERECGVCGRVEISVHDWEESERIEATHTSEGKIIYTCKNECGTTKEEVIPQIAHSFGTWEKYNETQHKRTCECDEIEYADHNYGDTLTKEATCKEAGYTYQICKDCGHTKKVEDIPAKGHSYGNTLTKGATCEEAGYIYHICKDCGYTEKVAGIAATGHTESKWIIDSEADCVTSGSKHKECKVCGKILVIEKISAKGHSYGNTLIKGATCEEAGYTYHICTICKYTEKVADIAATGHTDSEWIIDVEADCVTLGSKHKECKVCGKILVIEKIPAKGHSYGDTLTKEATCEEAGYTYHICKDCNHEEKILDIPAKGHREEVLPAKLPTCTETGLTEGAKCSVCDKILKVQMIVAEIGHEYGEWTVIKAATLDSAGEEICVCEHDENHVMTREIPKRVGQIVMQDKDHDDINLVIVEKVHGFSHDMKLVVEKIEQGKIDSYEYSLKKDGIIGNNDEVALIYDISLLLDGQSVQPDEDMNIKIRIPDEVKGKAFKLYHMHEGATTEIIYIIDGEYLVLNIDKLSEFIFVTNSVGIKTVKTNTYQIIFAILIALWILAIMLITYLIIKVLKLKKKDNIREHSNV